MSEQNRRWWTLGAVAFGLFMIMLDNTIVTVALPTIKRSFGINVSELEWIVTAYTLTFATFILTGGKLADLLGRRLMFNVGLAIFTISSFFCGRAGDVHMLIGARAVQGVGAAIMVPSTLSIITTAFPPRQRGTAIGVWAGTAGMALAIGPLLGGILTQQLSWHWIFYVNIPVGALALIASRIVIVESRDTSHRQSLDLPGLIASGLGLLALTNALIEGNNRGWHSPLIVGLFVFAGISMLIFVALEVHGRLAVSSVIATGLGLFALIWSLIELSSRSTFSLRIWYLHFRARLGWGAPFETVLFAFAGAALLIVTAYELSRLESVRKLVGSAARATRPRRERIPMLELSLFKIGNFTGSVLVALLVSLAMFGVFFFMSLYVQNILGYSPTRAGVSFLPMTVLVILVAPFAGRFSDRIGSRWLMASGMTLVSVSLYLFSRVGMHTTYPQLLPAMIVGGIGMPMAMSPTTAAAMATVPVDKAGVGSAVLNSFRQIGGALGIALLGAIMAAKAASFGNAMQAQARRLHLPPATPAQKQSVTQQAFVHGLNSALTVSAAIALGAAIVGAVLVRKRHHEHAEEPQPATTLA
ncbi:MAG: MFS transporter [Gaiellaceae bacterium]